MIKTENIKATIFRVFDGKTNAVLLKCYVIGETNELQIAGLQYFVWKMVHTKAVSPGGQNSTLKVNGVSYLVNLSSNGRIAWVIKP